MNDQPYGSYLIEERSEVNALKKKVRKLGVRIGLSEHRLAQLDIIIAEITSNFLKHAAPPVRCCTEVSGRAPRWE